LGVLGNTQPARQPPTEDVTLSLSGMIVHTPRAVCMLGLGIIMMEISGKRGFALRKIGGFYDDKNITLIDVYFNQL
jgi:hypothetical protein